MNISNAAFNRNNNINKSVVKENTSKTVESVNKGLIKSLKTTSISLSKAKYSSNKNENIIKPANISNNNTSLSIGKIKTATVTAKRNVSPMYTIQKPMTMPFHNKMNSLNKPTVDSKLEIRSPSNNSNFSNNLSNFKYKPGFLKSNILLDKKTPSNKNNTTLNASRILNYTSNNNNE